MEETYNQNTDDNIEKNNQNTTNIENNKPQEKTTSYQDLINNLNNPEKIQEATTKKANAKETHKKFKEYYYKVSHDDYYAAKAKLDQNVELKKNLREEMRRIESLKDKPTLTDAEAEEVSRIENLIAEQGKVPEKEKIITEKMNEIEEQLKTLRILVKESFE